MCGVSVFWVLIIKFFFGGKFFIYMIVVEGYIVVFLGIVFFFFIFWIKIMEFVSFVKIYLKLFNKVLNLEECILYYFCILSSYLVNFFE